MLRKAPPGLSCAVELRLVRPQERHSQKCGLPWRLSQGRIRKDSWAGDKRRVWDTTVSRYLKVQVSIHPGGRKRCFWHAAK